MEESLSHIIHEFKFPLQNPVLVFSLILFIILLSPILLRRLKIPGIIGLIISGVIIGPFGLNIIEQNSAVELFSTIGLIYIMFIAGLELDMNEFRATRNRSLLFGFFTFIIPLGIGFPVCHYLLGYDFNASFLTSSMFATHTLVAYPIVSRLGVSKNQAVAVTVGGTILTDTAVLLILAVIMGNHQGNLDSSFWLRLVISLILFSAIMFMVIPRISEWFFRKLESEKHSHYIYVLSVVFFAAFLAEIAGVEPIIGAFIAGLSLNKLIPHSSALMNRIEFIGNSLFIPFFLISVGMLVDTSVILKGPGALIVAGTLSVVALSGKWIAAFLTRLAFRYSKLQMNLIFGLSSAHAAATLAVIMVGFRAGILDENILNGTIILILVTCIIASFVTEKTSRELVIEAENGNEEITGEGFRAEEHILLPVSNIDNLERLIEFSVLIKDKKSANPVSVLTVVSNNDEAGLNIKKTRNRLEKFITLGSAAETLVNVMTTIDHNPASGISRVSREIMASMLVLGWPKRPRLLEKLIGEQSDSILGNTDKTAFMCRFLKPLPLHRRVVVAVPPLAEFEKGFSLWFTKVTQLAKELTVPVIILCNQATGDTVNKLIRRRKISVNISFVSVGSPGDLIPLPLQTAEDDLLILVSARKGSASYLSVMEVLPMRLENAHGTNSRIVVYPCEFDHDHIGEQYDDFIAEPINIGIEKLRDLRRSFGRTFKK